MTGMRLREAAQLAIQALSVLKPDNWEDKELQGQAWDALRAALSEEAMQRLTDVQQEMESMAWRNAAIRVGEDLCSVGPFNYYNMTAEQWLDWALSVVTVHAPPKREWVGLTEEEVEDVFPHAAFPWFFETVRAIEAKLKEKNS